MDLDEYAGNDRKYREFAEAFGKLAERRQAGDISFGDRDQEERSYSKKVNAEPDYFTKEDSAGRQLTAGQRAYFARSAIS
jgi:hypothetical protein